MKLSAALLASCATFLPQVAANFDVYMVTYAGITSWQVFPAEPSCDQSWGAPLWDWKDDVSGTKSGIRCKGSGCGITPSPSDIDILEMNFHGTNPIYHWSKA